MTMIPIFIVAAFIKHIPLSLSVVFIGIAGLVYHSYKREYPQLIWLDLISVLLGFSAYTYYSKMDDFVKNSLFLLEGIIISVFFVSMMLNIKPIHKILLSIMAIIWVPILFFSMKFFTNYTIFIASIVLLLYLYSECVCNKHKFTYLIWPSLHVTLFYFLYLSFNDMDLLKF
jgi:hypothetical protein